MANYKNVYKLELENDYYHFHHGANIVIGDNKEFKLHHHPYHEIYMYIRGKAEFFIEGTIFRLNPYDIIIVPPYTLHQPQPYVGEFFERYVVNVYPDFFQYMDCREYQDVFSKISNSKYKIPGHVVKRSNLINFMSFFEEKYNSGLPYITPLVNCKIVELLYNLNTIDNFEECDSVNKVAQEIITYIDKNFETITDIESVTSNFFYSKNHLCHLFKKYTGITITRYINIKKMENVEKLYKQGKSLTLACIESGFKSYDGFAYTYKKEFGTSPKKGL